MIYFHSKFKAKLENSSLVSLVLLFSFLSFFSISNNLYSQVYCDMIYVDAIRGNDGNQGLANAPVKTLIKAISLVSGSRNYIKMTSGTYTENTIIKLKDGLVIDGRYTNASGVWSKSSNTSASTFITLSGSETIDNDIAHVMGFNSDGKSNWKLIDLSISTVNATGHSNSRRGMSNYAIYIGNGSIKYEITRCLIASGRASDGQGRNTDTTLFNGKNGGAGSVGVPGGAGSSGFGYDAGGNGGNGGNGGAGGNNSSIIGGLASNGYSGGAGGAGRNDDNSGGSSGGSRTGTCSNGGGSTWGKPGEDCINNGATVISSSTTVVSSYISGYYEPGYGLDGVPGGYGGGGAGGGGADRKYSFWGVWFASGGGGSGGSGGGGGGGAGTGGRGGGSSYGIFIWNAGTGGIINNSFINTGGFGEKGTGGFGGIGGNGGAESDQGDSDNFTYRGGKGGAGSKGGKGGNGADGTDGERIAIAVHGGGVNPTFSATLPAIAVNSSVSGGSVINSPIISLNEIPNKICQNSVLNLSTTTPSWTLPSNWEFVKYNNTTVTSEYTSASTTADITTSNSNGFYDITANSIVFNSYLNVRSDRDLPVISINPSPACDGNPLTLNATSWGTEIEYKWDVFDATDAPDKGLTTNLVYSSTDAAPTTTLLTAPTSPKTYLIRYQVKEECCGWSIPVFETITVEPSLTPTVTITSSPNANVCIGTTVTFASAPINEGGAPVYQWKVNGVNAGTNSAIFVTSSLVNADNVSCEMTSSLTSCLTSSSDNSNIITMNIPVAGTLLSENETATCVVNGTDWVRFYGSTGHLLGVVNGQGDNLGNVDMETFVDSPMVMQACNTPHPLYHTAYMGRRWVMNSDVYQSGSDFTNNVIVRLPYNYTELADLNAHAQTATPANILDGGTIDPAVRSNLMLTKITGATEDGVANAADCASTIRGIPNSGNGTAIQGIPSTEYVDFSIDQFSEFFLHKNNNNSALPVTLTHLSASCTKDVTLNWTTESELNSDYFVVEKSRDGQTWSFVAEQPAAGNSNTTINYSQVDQNSWNGISYYRLRQFDFNGDQAVYGPISASCTGSESSMTVYPNPNKGSFIVEISSDETDAEVYVYLTDLAGKIIVSQQVNVSEGNAQIMMDNLDLSKGVYLVSLRGLNLQLKPVKVVVN